MKLLLSSAVLFGLLFLPSCDNDNDNEEKPVTAQALSNYFNIITNQETGEVTYVDGVSYSVTYDYGTTKATITLSGVKVPGGNSGSSLSYPTLTTPELTWTPNADGWKNISEIMVPTTAKNLGNTPTLDNFKFNLQDVWVDNNGYIAYTDIAYDLNGYHVLSLPKYMISLGTTKSQMGNTSYVYETEGTVYILEFTPGLSTVTLTVNNLTVVDGNTFKAVAIKGLPVVISSTGDVTISAPACTAMVVDSPVPDEAQMPVTDLNMSITNHVLKLSYNIVVGDISYQVSVN